MNLNDHSQIRLNPASSKTGAMYRRFLYGNREVSILVSICRDRDIKGKVMSQSQ